MAILKEGYLLRLRVGDPEQRTLSHTLEIRRLPHKKGDNLTSVVVEVGRCVDFVIAPEQLDDCFYFGPLREGSRPVAVRFV